MRVQVVHYPQTQDILALQKNTAAMRFKYAQFTMKNVSRKLITNFSSELKEVSWGIGIVHRAGQQQVQF